MTDTNEDRLDLNNVKSKHKFAMAMVAALCQPKGSVGSREWIMSIPARPTYDPDLVISDSLGDIPRLISEVERSLNDSLAWEAVVDEDIKEMEILTAELEAVKKERDELKNYIHGNKATTWEKLSHKLTELEAENVDLKAKLEKAEEREVIIEKVHKALYENMETLPYEISKMIDENFWELF